MTTYSLGEVAVIAEMAAAIYAAKIIRERPRHAGQYVKCWKDAALDAVVLYDEVITECQRGGRGALRT